MLRAVQQQDPDAQQHQLPQFYIARIIVNALFIIGLSSSLAALIMGILISLYPNDYGRVKTYSPTTWHHGVLLVAILCCFAVFICGIVYASILDDFYNHPNNATTRENFFVCAGFFFCTLAAALAAGFCYFAPQVAVDHAIKHMWVIFLVSFGLMALYGVIHLLILHPNRNY